MLKGSSPSETRQKLGPFINPEILSSNGRRIGIDTAKDCGLNVEEVPLKDERWQTLWELYVRVDWCVDNRSSKVVETVDHHFMANKVAVS